MCTGSSSGKSSGFTACIEPHTRESACRLLFLSLDGLLQKVGTPSAFIFHFPFVIIDPSQLVTCQVSEWHMLYIGDITGLLHVSMWTTSHCYAEMLQFILQGGASQPLPQLCLSRNIQNSPVELSRTLNCDIYEHSGTFYHM